MASKLYLGETHSELVRKFNELVDEFGRYLTLSGGTLTGALTTKDLTLKGIEQFQTHYAKKLIGTLSAGTNYENLDSKYKDGTYHRMWRLRFPASCNFWGKIKITLYGGYSSFNASGIMSKSITCNFNGSSIYNNVGFYDGLGVNVEKDFRISEAIWNSTASAWEILIWQKNLNGNNSPTILLEAWSSSEINLTNAKNITAQAVELTQATTYTASKASSTGGTKTVTWATTPVYETPLGEEIATMSDIPSAPSVSVTQKLTSGTEIGSVTVGSTTTKLYAPTASVSGNYLPLSGGTLTGDINFNTGTDDYTKTIGTANGLAYIDFEGGYGSLDLFANDSILLDSTNVLIKGDQNGNFLSLDGDGITINADGTQAGDIILSAKQGVISAKAPTNVSGQEQVTAWFNTANGGRIGFGKEGPNSGTGIFVEQEVDQNGNGKRRLNFRASATAGAMVWEQPEQGAQLYMDLGKKGSDYRRISFPSSGGTLALVSQITSECSKKLDKTEFNSYKESHSSEYQELNNKISTFLGTNTETLSGIKDLIAAAEESDEISALTTALGNKANSNEVLKLSGGTMTGSLKIQQGQAINVSQYNDADGVSLMNNGGGTATQFGSSARPARMFSSVQPEWYKNGASQGVLAIKSDIPTSLKNPNALTFGSKTYDGSSAQTITASDIGASKRTTQTATVIGTSKTTEAIGEYQLVFPKGAVFSGTAASAGLVTRGICGVTTPEANGSCSKENLYINYDGNNNYNAGRQLVLQAGQVGTHYGNNLYQYCAARGDAVKGYVDANTIKSLSASGTTITYTKGDGSTGTITTQDQYVKNTHTAVNRQASLALLPNNTSSEGTSKVYKNTSLYANPYTGALYATSFYENNTALSEKYHPKKRKVTLAELRTAMQTMTTGTRIQVVPRGIDEYLLYSVGACIAYSKSDLTFFNAQTRSGYVTGGYIYCKAFELEIDNSIAEYRYLEYRTNGSQLMIDNQYSGTLTDDDTDFYILD